MFTHPSVAAGTSILRLCVPSSARSRDCVSVAPIPPVAPSVLFSDEVMGRIPVGFGFTLTVSVTAFEVRPKVYLMMYCIVVVRSLVHVPTPIPCSISLWTPSTRP